MCNVVRPHSGCCITASNLYGNEEITECHYNVAMAGSSPFIPIIHHVIRRATLAAIEKTKMLNGDFTVSDSQFLCFLFVFFFLFDTFSCCYFRRFRSAVRPAPTKNTCPCSSERTGFFAEDNDTAPRP